MNDTSTSKNKIVAHSTAIATNVKDTRAPRARKNISETVKTKPAKINDATLNTLVRPS